MNKLLEMLLDSDEPTDAILATVYINRKMHFNELVRALKGVASRQTISTRIKKLLEYNVLTGERVLKGDYAVLTYEFSENFQKQKDYAELRERYGKGL
jgi:DNA-binding transcriptional regulator GbsR (MarR family)